MRYLFISDVHGEYDRMIEALTNANFNPEKDTLVTLGDLFDRGLKSKEVLEYVMSLPHYIAIMGNHDLRLKELMCGASAKSYDKSNGVPETLFSFGQMPKIPNVHWGMQVFLSDDTCRATRQLLWKYLDSCSWAIEFPDLIGTHAWLPSHVDFPNPIDVDYYLNQNWRTNSTRVHWSDAVWCNTEEMLANHVFPDKNMVVGHWHAWRIATKYETTSRVSDNYINCDTYVRHLNTNWGVKQPIDLIFIDGCSNYALGGKVNVFVYESDADPILYKC